MSSTSSQPHFQKDTRQDGVKNRLKSDFYDSDCETLAKELLGKVLCFEDEAGNVIKGRVVETEMYPGASDAASHSFKGETKRNASMFKAAGTAYVYFIYGMYFCFNVSSAEKGGAVLVRALEPVYGLDVMRTNRGKKMKKKLRDFELCNGPSRICAAFGITRDNSDGIDMTEDNAKIWIEGDEDAFKDVDFVQCTRIGIDGAGAESASKPFRFYIRDNRSVSVVEDKRRRKK